MSVKLAAWNVQERLGIEEHSSQIAESVKKLDADVVILSDACWLGNPIHAARPEIVQTAIDTFNGEGYDAYGERYQDREGHWPGRYLLALSRVETTFYRGKEDSLAPTANLYVEDPDTKTGMHILGTHLDDRNENYRLAQARQLVSRVQTIDEPAVLAGDLNMMHHDDWRARLLRTRFARQYADRQPSLEPRNDYEIRHGRPSQWERLVGMADGRAMDLFLIAGLMDADPKNRPTMTHKGHAMVQLDHILANRRVQTSDFQVHKLEGSDHRPISAVLHV